MTLSKTVTALLTAIAVLCYIATFASPAGAAAILIALPALCLLALQSRPSRALAIGIVIGFIIYEILLAFLYTLFNQFAIVLWLLGSLQFGVFLLLLCLAHRRLGPAWAMCLTPVLWTGLEYFRSEIWSLRFAWLLPGQAAALLPGVRCLALGVYGLGFVYVLLAALAVGPRKWQRATGIVGLILAALLMYVPPFPQTPIPTAATLHVAGLQTEAWGTAQIAEALDHLAESHPEAQLLVLSECAFQGPVPAEVRDVLRKHHRYLIAGGSIPPKKHFRNTAFVVGPDGSDVFSQDKSVPVQFMEDGIPAAERHVWNSPWGKIGIAICYDASYARVMDDFVRQGACGLIIPTMDVRSWGEFERRMLHGRMQPVRSAEYGIPTFGVWSSGVSQLTDRFGRIVATTSYPGAGDTIDGSFDLSRPGRIPPDRPLALASLAGTVLFLSVLILRGCGRIARVISNRRAEV